jgi:hypothetical protein
MLTVTERQCSLYLACSPACHQWGQVVSKFADSLVTVTRRNCHRPLVISGKPDLACYAEAARHQHTRTATAMYVAISLRTSAVGVMNEHANR